MKPSIEQYTIGSDVQYQVETFSYTPREDPEKNEDGMLVMDAPGAIRHAFGVFDGATGVGGVADGLRTSFGQILDKEPVSGGLFATQIVKNAIQDYYAQQIMNFSLHSVSALKHGNNCLRNSLDSLDVPPKSFTRVASTLGALLAIRDNHSIDWAYTRSDVSIFGVGGDSISMRSHPLDWAEGHALALALRNSPFDMSRSLQEDLEVQNYINDVNRRGENTSRYGSINGSHSALFGQWIAAKGGQPLKKSDRVILLTDGMLPEKPKSAYESKKKTDKTIELNEGPFLKAQAEQKELVFRLLNNKDGLVCLHDYVREQQESDPTCTKYPRFKKDGDDATGIIITRI